VGSAVVAVVLAVLFVTQHRETQFAQLRGHELDDSSNSVNSP
jgi:hypothetical protein